MLSRAKTAAHLSGLVGSDSEPDFDDFEPQSATITRTVGYPMPAVKKPRGRPAAANRVTKPAPKTTRRTSGRITTVAQAEERQALTDKSNTVAPVIADVDEPRSRRGKVQKVEETPVAKVQTKAARGRPKAVKSQAASVAGATDEVVPSARRGRPPANKPAANLPDEIPETQLPEPMEVDEESEQLSGIEELSHIPSDSPPGDILPDLEGSDASLRRRLGDLTRKYDGLEKRHRELKEVGVKEAERVYERLKKQSQDNDAASKKLVARLKDEIAAQAALLKQGELRQQQLERSEAKAKGLEEQVAKLTSLLAESKAEMKTLSMRLAASRTAEANAKVPGSAIKTGAASRGMSAPSEAVQNALAKEDLYGDLTGLIVRAVKRNDTEDTFDCIQTGRNGTLHFKLVLEKPDASDNYADVDVTYQPQLDPDRDEEMMEILPDYLIDEITFPRPQASNFYRRVIKSLNEQLD